METLNMVNMGNLKPRPPNFLHGPEKLSDLMTDREQDLLTRAPLLGSDAIIGIQEKGKLCLGYGVNFRVNL